MAVPPSILGEDPAFLEVEEQISRLAAIDRPCLVIGERGTGKELLATRLHYLSPRWDGPLVKVNCAALAESLLDTELFGHEAGAFTGAQRQHVGRFERAHGGTLLLDEIASASAAVQEKVLRVIEYGEMERVGGRRTIQLDVRVIGAANVDLPSLARNGAFRADLLDRLAFEVVTIPPLRARPADIMALANAFALEITRALDKDVFPGFGPRAEASLHGHSWPGNVRELKNVVERAVYRSASSDGPIDTVIIDPFENPWRPPRHPGGADADDRTPVPPPAASEPAGLARTAEFPVDFSAEVARFERDLLERALDASPTQSDQYRPLTGARVPPAQKTAEEARPRLRSDADRASPGGPRRIAGTGRGLGFASALRVGGLGIG